MCFGTTTFDTDTFQRAIYIRMKANTSYRLSGDLIILCVPRVDRFRIMIDFFKDGSTCLFFCKTLPFSGLNGGHV